MKEKCFEAGQHGEESGHCLGWKIPGMRDIKKVKAAKVSGGQNQFWQSWKWNAIQPEESQTRGRSTQERIGNDRWCFTERGEPQLCQLREWHLHRCQHFIQWP